MGPTTEPAKHASAGIVLKSPEGSLTMHAPPDAMTILSVTDGPTNCIVNSTQTPVATAHFNILRTVRF